MSKLQKGEKKTDLPFFFFFLKREVTLKIKPELIKQRKKKKITIIVRSARKKKHTKTEHANQKTKCTLPRTNNTL